MVFQNFMDTKQFKQLYDAPKEGQKSMNTRTKRQKHKNCEKTKKNTINKKMF